MPQKLDVNELLQQVINLWHDCRENSGQASVLLYCDLNTNYLDRRPVTATHAPGHVMYAPTPSSFSPTLIYCTKQGVKEIWGMANFHFNPFDCV